MRALPLPTLARAKLARLDRRDLQGAIDLDAIAGFKHVVFGRWRALAIKLARKHADHCGFQVDLGKFPDDSRFDHGLPGGRAKRQAQRDDSLTRGARIGDFDFDATAS